MANTVVQRFIVQPRSELRVEIGEAEAFITVTEGTAEIFGAVVQLHRRLRLVQCKIAIFTYDGCCVTLEGMPSESPYVLPAA
jgi:N-terminal beta-sandwich domain of polyadenylation factor